MQEEKSIPSLLAERLDQLEEYEKHEKENALLNEIGRTRLLELAQAEKDGRLAALPCKPGDFLYEVDLPEYGVITCKVLHVGYYIGPAGHVPGNPMVSVVSVGVKVIDGHGEGSSYDFEADDFGKTVFFTREEADAALKGGAE